MKQLALGRPLRRTWQEGGTETRDVSTISTGPQATVGKTSFSTPWGTLDFFSRSGEVVSQGLEEPWQTLMIKAEHEMMNINYLFVLAQKTLCSGTIKIVSKVSPNFGCLFLRNNTVPLDRRHGCRLKTVQ